MDPALKISQSDQLTTPAGTGVLGSAHLGGPATNANFAPWPDPRGDRVTAAPRPAAMWCPPGQSMVK
jgi:hypothetical protein